MLLTPHTLVGIAVASVVKNPLIAFPVSVGMHYLGDLVPHWDFFSNTNEDERVSGWRPLAVAGELSLAVATGTAAVLYALWIVNDPALGFRMLICGIGGVIPDLLSGLTLYEKNLNGFLKINNRIQAKLQFQSPLPWGILTQILVSVFCALVILGSTAQ
ncbi:MAG: hypothetical protein UU64_C0016G0024 [candidate division WWE3 bacterium GW2011_GWF2_41_45]|uniref:Uncharacterized protein n=3 Tax=Katanobacteria TaxID=422282 RepID=A0A1F4VZ57_UNCKA|nr:MAG: hypothetical protein UU55_C0010G0020 [candidate division WWE3 bacterium GW2011_GWC2_41_23]KKS09556.1 MAG: hypothetical protein UU64_C0016G0024 [candidate division WWE3 bacterium GW2011_GWF2_41_45]KKS12124.1 MAG: hypothetical protein UU68_C0005G0026 [candidate division WWE3 bacterium GW2011_GWF1_41_53]KKS28077.1 MAG: hypothetical protein UU86_C0013G0006 [candidate division WWE3 bacterium GW2011_GWC1_42_102]KKS28860.1 MAG: hypothetical protein UU90_C0016G0008 [candidate division WWE3 bact